MYQRLVLLDREKERTIIIYAYMMKNQKHLSETSQLYLYILVTSIKGKVVNSTGTKAVSNMQFVVRNKSRNDRLRLTEYGLNTKVRDQQKSNMLNWFGYTELMNRN